MKVPIRTGIHLEKTYPFKCDLNGAPKPRFFQVLGNMIRDVHPGSGSRILIFLTIPDPGSRGQGNHRIPDTRNTVRNKLSFKTVPTAEDPGWDC
jgi:hypothetical protein